MDNKLLGVSAINEVENKLSHLLKLGLSTAYIAQTLNQIPRPTNDNPDYAYNEYTKKYGAPDQSKGQHLTDEFKLPNHITFSDSSRYSAPDMQGGSWKSGGQDRWAFYPSKQNFLNYSPQQLSDYFRNFERKHTFINFPNGQNIEGSQ